MLTQPTQQISTTELEEAKNLKIFLHEHIYDANCGFILQQILKEISDNFNLFTLDYSNEQKNITMKIKKTDMKKTQSFEHNSSFYYQIINNILCNVFSQNKMFIESTLNRCANLNINTKYLYNYNCISMIYNITTLSDNIVVIYL